MIEKHEEQYECLEKLEGKKTYTDEDLSNLLDLANSDDSEIRMRVADELGFVSPELAKDALFKLLNDKDELVRASACDSLCNGKSIDVYLRLKEVFRNDESMYVRSYSILSIVDVYKNKHLAIPGNEIVSFLKEALDKETESQIKIPLYRGLYILGETRYLDSLIDELNGEIYQNRCATINMLEEILNESNQEAIESALISRKLKESSVAVISSIDRVLASSKEP